LNSSIETNIQVSIGEVNREGGRDNGLGGRNRQRLNDRANDPSNSNLLRVNLAPTKYQISKALGGQSNRRYGGFAEWQVTEYRGG
jgi:hypothetical protein